MTKTASSTAGAPLDSISLTRVSQYQLLELDTKKNTLQSPLAIIILDFGEYFFILQEVTNYLKSVTTENFAISEGVKELWKDSSVKRKAITLKFA